MLDDRSLSINLGFEVGYAFACDKKIMVILSPESRFAPSDLVSTHHIRANPSDAEGIAFNLDMLLATPEPRRRPYIPQASETYPIGRQADPRLNRLSGALQEHDPEAMVRIVTDALRASGVKRISSAAPTSPDGGFDLGVWCDDLESSVGNPLLIELKLNIPSWRSVKMLTEQVASLARSRSVDWALILYGDGPPNGIPRLRQRRRSWSTEFVTS